MQKARLLYILGALLNLLLTGCGGNIDVSVKDQTINAGDAVEIEVSVTNLNPLYLASVFANDGITYWSTGPLKAGKSKFTIYPLRTGKLTLSGDVFSPFCRISILSIDCTIANIGKQFQVTVNQDVPIANIPKVSDPALQQWIDDRNVAMVSELTYLDCSNYELQKDLQGIGFYYALEELRLPPNYLAIYLRLEYLNYLSHLSDLYIGIDEDWQCQTLQNYLARWSTPFNVHSTSGLCDL